MYFVPLHIIVACRSALAARLAGKAGALAWAAALRQLVARRPSQLAGPHGLEGVEASTPSCWRAAAQICWPRWLQALPATTSSSTPARTPAERIAAERARAWRPADAHRGRRLRRHGHARRGSAAEPKPWSGFRRCVAPAAPAASPPGADWSTWGDHRPWSQQLSGSRPLSSSFGNTSGRTSLAARWSSASGQLRRYVNVYAIPFSYVLLPKTPKPLYR
jgi:hypothetical protein